MRAYVINSKAVMADEEDSTATVAVTSSKKTAIAACNDFLKNVDGNGIVWEEKDKHTGYAVKGDHVVTYEMFFVNKVELED